MLAAIDEAGSGRRALRVFLTADEEQGSRTAREPLREAVDGVAAAFVVEPPTAEGHLKTSRKGLGRFRISVEGRPAHAGTNLLDGASAVEELAQQVIRVHALTDHERGVSVNVGTISGGTAENVVAAHAEAKLDVRVTHADGRRDRRRRSARPRAGRRGHEDHRLRRLDETAARADARVTQAVREGAGACARARARPARGVVRRRLGCESHQPWGVPVLDGLGAQGGGAHAHHEHVRLDTLPLRARLLARLLEDPGST